MKTKEIGELITIAEVIYETLDSSNLNTEELAFVMNQDMLTKSRTKYKGY